jgi:DNA-binding MarR family transcriptional regulator
MTVSKTTGVDTIKPPRLPRRENGEGTEAAALHLGELSELLGYSLKRAQLKVFEDFLNCVAPLQLTPAQFSVLLLLDRNPGRNQTEIANTLGILRPNFVAMLDGLESRDLCARMRSTNDRRSHILVLTCSRRSHGSFESSPHPEEPRSVGWAKARTRRAHLSTLLGMVGTLRFAHPTILVKIAWEV